ncbi:MAG: HAD hydrolase-like protein [Clostridia bacterium]|nr:HAD hydrolase-like protein [Clostridia bacterium]
MIKNIIFDLGNVIVQNPNIEIVKEFFKEEKDAINFNEYIFKSEFWKLMDLGKMNNLEIANAIKEEKLVDVTNYDEVENFMLNWFTKCNVNFETMEIGKRLKQKGYNIYILSNMSKATFEYFSKKYEFFTMVDGAIVSAYEGIKKPDSKIFELLLERYSLNAEECILIDDDDTNKTLEVANFIGINGRRVNSNDSDDVIELLKENNIEIR